MTKGAKPKTVLVRVSFEYTVDALAWVNITDERRCVKSEMQQWLGESPSARLKRLKVECVPDMARRKRA